MSKVINQWNFAQQGVSINDDPALEREADVMGSRYPERDLHSATTIVNENSSGDQFFQQNYGPMSQEEKVNRGVPILNSLNEIEGPNSPVTQNFSTFLRNVSNANGQTLAPSQSRVLIFP